MRTKQKTLAAWLAFLTGPLGGHRFYLYGIRDALAWLLPWPTLAGLYGLWRVGMYGLDDRWSWILVPTLGFTLAGCALNAIVIGLCAGPRWNRLHNPGLPQDHPAGATGWPTVGAIVLALLVGTTILMSSLVYSFQRYFEVQIEAARRISQ